jgi:hypothetical protein
LRYWEWIWQQDTESVFWLFLRKTEEAAEECRRWFPRLQSFAAECRQVVPVPAVDNFSATERAQYCVLLAKMREFDGSADRRCILSGKPNQAVILWTNKVGLPAVQEIFGKTGAIILEESEKHQWFSSVYDVNYEAFWWYAFAWWTLKEGLPNEDESVIRQNYPIPEGCSYWAVESGVQWGSLAGGANHELWRWDGKQAEFIETYCIDTY